MKKLFALIMIMAVSQLASANPEIGRQVHFVLDKNNADHELKMDAGNCEGGVIPEGNGVAHGEIRCEAFFRLRPWRSVRSLGRSNEYYINARQTANIPCELYDYSNNAGNNNGYNVTQYNAPDWVSNFKATEVSDGFIITASTVCLNGLQQ